MTRQRRIARPWLLALAVVTGLALGVTIDIARNGGLEGWLAGRGVSAPYEALGRTVEIDGVPVYVDCRGAGSPTVILEAGFGSGAASWGAVLDAVAATTRVCAWDRPGIGQSAARPLHSAGDTARILRAALGAAGEAGPYVVVGHSLGGVYGRLFLAAGEVEGFVMIDTYEPDLGLDRDPALSEADRAIVRQSIVDTGAMLQAGEALDWAATMAELEALGPVTLPGATLWVDPNLRYGAPTEERRQALVEAWYRGVAARYPEAANEVVPNTGHLIHLERPDLVIDRIVAVVLSARAAP